MTVVAEGIGTIISLLAFINFGTNDLWITDLWFIPKTRPVPAPFYYRAMMSIAICILLCFIWYPFYVLLSSICGFGCNINIYQFLNK